MAGRGVSVPPGRCHGSSPGTNKQASLTSWSVLLPCSQLYPVSARHGHQRSNHLSIVILAEREDQEVSPDVYIPVFKVQLFENS